MKDYQVFSFLKVNTFGKGSQDYKNSCTSLEDQGNSNVVVLIKEKDQQLKGIC